MIFMHLSAVHAVQMDPSSFAELCNQETAQQQQSPAVRSTVHSTGSEATPAAAIALLKKRSMHLEEAKEMCPEGHELSESYQPHGLHATPSGTHFACIIRYSRLVRDRRCVYQQRLLPIDHSSICEYQSQAASDILS